MYHGFGNVDSDFIVTYEPAPADHPTEGLLDHPTSRQDLEDRLIVDAADDPYDEVQESSLVDELSAIIGAVDKEMLEPRPTCADGIEDQLGSGTIGDIGGRQVCNQQAAIGIDHDMSLASVDFLARIAAAGALTDWLSMMPAVGLAPRNQIGNIARRFRAIGKTI